MGSVALKVNGRAYGGWKSVRVTQSIEQLVGSFELTASDRWGGQDLAWPIFEEDECTVEINGEQVISGFVDKRSIQLAGEQRALSYSGRDAAAQLADCSALLDKWTFRNASVLDIAKKLAAPFSLPVALQSGLTVPKSKTKLVVSPGDTAFQAIESAARSAGVLVISDGDGGILITRAGDGHARSALVEGDNLLGISVEYDGADRFYRYIVVTQTGGSAESSGNHCRVRAFATDEGVRRTDRTLLIRPEHGVTAEFARRRADWEARVRAAKAETATAVVRGWEQSDGGPIWRRNELVTVRSPSVGIAGDMLIATVTYSMSEAGQTTELLLVRPDAFEPEPQQAKVKRSGTRWKELDKVPGVSQ